MFSPAKIERARLFVDAWLKTNFTLTEFAEMAGISPSTASEYSRLCQVPKHIVSARADRKRKTLLNPPALNPPAPDPLLLRCRRCEIVLHHPLVKKGDEIFCGWCLDETDQVAAANGRERESRLVKPGRGNSQIQINPKGGDAQ